jgi:hypothetical protein
MLSRTRLALGLEIRVGRSATRDYSRISQATEVARLKSGNARYDEFGTLLTCLARR